MTNIEVDGRWEAAQEGAERLREDDPDGAIEALLQVVHDDPRNEYAHFFLGHAHYAKAHYERALQSYVRALEIAPSYLGALVASGHALRQLGKLREAIRVGRQALSMRPEDPDALHLLGLSLLARGETSEARRHLVAFLTTGPEFEVAMEVRAMIEALDAQLLSGEH